MKKDQNGFGVAEALLVIIVLAIIGAIGWTVVRHNTNLPNVAIPTSSIPHFTSNITEGSHSINLKTKDVILMPSGALLILPEFDASSVPEFIYDKDYKSNTKKYLSIRSQLDAYHNGYHYKITKGQCNKEEKSFDDYTQVVVTDCKVNVDVQKSHLTQLPALNVTKQYIVTEKNNPAGGPQQVLSKDPFLMVGGGDSRLTQPINNGKPYLGASYEASLTLLITVDYGTGFISYNADEFVAKKEKQITINSSTVKIKPNSITCTAAYMANDRCAIVMDKFVFDVSYSRQPSNNSEILIFNLQ